MQLNRLKEILDSKGISQTWLAKQLNKSFGTVNAWCLNKSQPSLGTLYRISEVISVDMRDLIANQVVNAQKTDNNGRQQF